MNSKTMPTSAKTSSTRSASPRGKRTAQPATEASSPQRKTEGKPASGPSQYMTRKNFEALKAASQWRGVFCDGPIAHKPTEEADEIPTWIVFIGTKEREPVSKTYQCHSAERAKTLAGMMARDRGIELIDEATTA